jgi:hypothetical protein
MADTGLYVSPTSGVGDIPHVRPPEAQHTPLLSVIAATGETVSTIDSVSAAPGYYISWLKSQTAVGVVADTIVSVNVTDAVVSLYRLGAHGAAISPEHIRTVQLPRYFQAPPPKERILPLPWITRGGLFRDFEYAPHLGDARVGPTGRLYVIRNYMFKWYDSRSRLFGVRGSWVASERALEVYDLTGALLRAFVLPANDIEWVRVDPSGRLLFRTSESMLLVTNDPTSPEANCPDLPATITIAVPDSPPPTFE